MSQNYFLARTGGFLKRVNYDDIHYLETADNYTKVYTSQGYLSVRTTFKQALEDLKERRFVQVHRCYAVSVDNIDLITGENITLLSDPENPMPYNPKYLPALLKLVKVLGPQFDLGDEGDD